MDFLTQLRHTTDAVAGGIDGAGADTVRALGFCYTNSPFESFIPHLRQQMPNSRRRAAQQLTDRRLTVPIVVVPICVRRAIGS